MAYKLISVPLAEHEIEQLQELARQNFRRPRDHVRYLVLNALGMTTSSNDSTTCSENSKTPTGLVSEAETVSAFAGITNS